MPEVHISVIDVELLISLVRIVDVAQFRRLHAELRELINRSFMLSIDVSYPMVNDSQP